MVMTREASEPRWPAGLALIGLIAALALLPGRLKLMPEWFVYALGFVVIAPMAAVGLTRTNVRWLRIERAILLGFFGVVTLLTFAGLTELIHTMIRRSSSLSGLTLLSSSIALWIANITNYSLLYWQLDRGGPEARLSGAGGRPDWLFPQDGASENHVPAGWRPTFVDYLYLAYSTATAFSTTEVSPLTSRAKLLMMFESAISLMVIVIVGARAINILGG
jgi:hypothetical protein